MAAKVVTGVAIVVGTAVMSYWVLDIDGGMTRPIRPPVYGRGDTHLSRSNRPEGK